MTQETDVSAMKSQWRPDTRRRLPPIRRGFTLVAANTAEIVMRSRVVLSAALAAVIGCGSGSDSPTATHPDAASRLRLVVVGGGSQQAFPGDELSAPLVVQVIDSAARPVAGKRRVRFSVVSGAGTVSDSIVLTADGGSASVTWKLGAAVGTQQISAALADDGPSTQTIALATAVSPDAADLVIVRGATSGDVQVLLNQDDVYTRYRLTWPDTVIRLLPRGQFGSWQEVTAFSAEHPPVTALQPWTAGIDTVRLILGAPIVVPFTMWVTNDFDTTSVRARYDAAQVDKFWRSHLTGLRVGPVRIENLAAYQGKIAQCADVPVRDTTAINVYYLASQIPGGTSLQCSASVVLVAPNFYAFDPMYQLYLAHDVGHAFGLEHIADASNLMSISFPPGGGLTTGQIYRMHFQNTGTANVVLRAHTVGVRNCYSTVTHCPAQTFVGW